MQGRTDSISNLWTNPDVSKQARIAHFEMLLQKANSINGIRRLNMKFKTERRQVKIFDSEQQITDSYWQLCDEYLQLMEHTRRKNLETLFETKNVNSLLESLRSEIDFDLHSCIGLGKRMPKFDPKTSFEAVNRVKQSYETRYVALFEQIKNTPRCESIS